MEVAKREKCVGEGRTPEGRGYLRWEERKDADMGGLAGFVLGTKLDRGSKAVDVGEGMDVCYKVV